MPYPNEPTVHESLQQFFTFYENYSTREDVEEAIALGNIDGDHSYFKDVAAFETVKKFIEETKKEVREEKDKMKSEEYKS